MKKRKQKKKKEREKNVLGRHPTVVVVMFFSRKLWPMGRVRSLVTHWVLKLMMLRDTLSLSLSLTLSI